MLGTSLVVDGIDGIDNVDDVLDGDGLVGTQDDTGVGDAGLDAGGDERLETLDIGGCVADLELMVFINVDGHVLLGHSLAAAFGQEQLDGVGADERGGHHEKDQKEEHQVRHGGVVVLDGQFISCFYHNLDFLEVLVMLVFLGFKRVRGGGP